MNLREAEQEQALIANRRARASARRNTLLGCLLFAGVCGVLALILAGGGNGSNAGMVFGFLAVGAVVVAAVKLG